MAAANGEENGEKWRKAHAGEIWLMAVSWSVYNNMQK